jgi:glutamine amidotransferase
MTGSPRVAIIDYGAGNLASVVNALWVAGAEPSVARTPDDLKRADRLILPGVGAGGAALDALRRTGFDQALGEARSAGQPILGICVGLQMMAEQLEEFGQHQGLGWIKGRVTRIPSRWGVRVPHMGWAKITPTAASREIFAGGAASQHYYFCHSYMLTDDKNVATATVNHGEEFTVAVRFENVMAVQFHPEKSQVNGRRLLERFLDWRP